MSKIDTALSEVFGVPPTDKPQRELIVNDPSTIDELDDVDDDVLFIKDNLKNLITKGENAFENLAEIANAEESPRAYEVLNAMLSTLSDLSMQLMTLHEKRSKLKSAKKEAPQQSPTVNNNTTTNIAFVGTTTELQAMMKQKQLDHLRTLDQ